MRIKLPFDVPPLQANKRMHWRTKAAFVREVRRDAGWVVRDAAVLPADSITVGLEWVPRVNRRRDGGENLTDTLKACIDGIVDAGIVPDDTPEYVTRLMPVVLPVDRDNPGVWLVIE